MNCSVDSMLASRDLALWGAQQASSAQGPRTFAGRSGEPGGSRDAMISEPRSHPMPSVVSLRGSVARAIVGIKTVRRIRKDYDLRRLACGLQRRAHRFNLGNRNSRVGAPVKTQYRSIDLLNDIDRIPA
jgi:hypothetical protein